MRDRYEIDSNYTAEEARIIAGVRYAINVRYLINTSDYIFVKDADMKLIATLRENNIEGVNKKNHTSVNIATSAAAHILGYTGAMSDSDYAKYKDQGYSADAAVGKDGAEYAFEKIPARNKRYRAHDLRFRRHGNKQGIYRRAGSRATMCI